MIRPLLTLLFCTLLSLQALAGPLAAVTEEQPAKEPEPVVQGGLLGTLASGLDDVSQELNIDHHLLDSWRLRTDRAAKEVNQLVDRHDAGDLMSMTWDFLILAARASQRSRLLRERPRPQKLLGYLLPYTLPAIASLPAALFISRQLDPSVGRALGMSLAYATSSGIFSTTLILCLITLFDVGHKRTAVRIIREAAPRPLFMIGFLAAWSDALTSPQISRQIGGNLTSSIAVITGLLATLIFAVVVLRSRRPVAHLIRNRSLKDRLQHRAVQETLRIFSAIWYLPILMMIMVSGINLIGAGEESQRALQKALLTTVLLIGTVFLSITLQHFLNPPRNPEQRLRPYKELLYSLAHALLRIAMAVAFIELLGRIWGFSVLDFALRNSFGRAISDSLSSIGLILLVTWLLWVVIDTAIQEALKPTPGRRNTRQPSTRTRTILPMLRNATKVVLVVICTITTMANLGINVAPFLAGAGVVGLAIGFGSQQLVQDVITGLFILIEDTIAIGDWACRYRGKPDHPHPAPARRQGLRALGAVRADQGRHQPVAAVRLRVLLGAVQL